MTSLAVIATTLTLLIAHLVTSVRRALRDSH